jgi:glycerophosphoryl diester phosphodiesterase
VPLVQLVEAQGRPWDLAHGRVARTYADMIRPEGLRDVATYARGVGVPTKLVIPRDEAGRSMPPTRLVRDAHEAGLLVHVWTLRAENAFLPAERRRGADPATLGDLAGQAALFVEAGVDGFFTDHPALGVAARDGFRRGY